MTVNAVKRETGQFHANVNYMETDFPDAAH